MHSTLLNFPVSNRTTLSSAVIEKLDKVSEIDYTLLSAPVCTANYVETNHKVTYPAI